MSDDAQPFTTRPLSNALGAEIVGVDLTRPPAPALLAALRAAWHAHHVLLFRGNDLSPAQQIAFSRAFGELDTHDATPRDRLPGHPEILFITTRETDGKPSETRAVGRNWHSDYAYTPRPAAASMLYCVEKPDVGGDTMFCNMARAYEGLSATLRSILDGLHSVYDFSLVADMRKRSPDYVARLLEINPPIAHPTVCRHPDSGVKALFVSERVSHFDGMTRSESEPLIRYLCDVATRPENVYRHRWRPGDLLCWDNRTCMHLALADFDPQSPRTMRRTTLAGPPSGHLVAAD